MQKNIRIYQCEDTVNGILSAVYDAGISGYGHDYIRIQPLSSETTYNYDLFSEYVKVETSDEKVTSVINAVRNKISYEAYKYVMTTAISDDSRRGDVIYQFVTYGFTVGSNVTKALQLDCVRDIFEINRNVQNEVYRFIEILRFHEISKNPSILLAKMEPKHRITAQVTTHFNDRFNAENFIIFDKTHNEASFHSSNGEWEVRILTDEEADKLDEYSEKDEKYAGLWKVFFKSISVEERKSHKNQRTNLPIYLRKHMNEFED